MSLKIPKIIGHRGACGYAPENTLESIHTAADMGIQWVELDVKLTKDEVPIIMHDDTLDRTTNSTGNVAEKTYQELKELDAGSWYADSFYGAHIPTLEQAIEVIIDRGLGLNLEIKPCPGREKLTAEVALDLLSTIWDDHDRLLISSFQNVSLETAMDIAYDWHRGLLIGEEFPENIEELIKFFDVSCVNVNANTITREEVEQIIEIGMPILSYTVNQPDQARLLQSWGVDGFFSDTPDVIQENIFIVH